MIDGGEIFSVVKFVAERGASGDFKLHDLVIGEMVEVFDEGAETVAMSDDENFLMRLKEGKNFGVPVGKNAIDGI